MGSVCAQADGLSALSSLQQARKFILIAGLQGRSALYRRKPSIPLNSAPLILAKQTTRRMRKITNM
jgi:hypothetical protein